MKAGNKKMGVVVPVRADGAAKAVGWTEGERAPKISPWAGEWGMVVNSSGTYISCLDR